MNQRVGYVKCAAAVPVVALADCAENARRIVAMMRSVEQHGVDIAIFPELSVTGYTCGDLFLQPKLLSDAEEALRYVVDASVGVRTTVIVGVPVADGGRLYN